MRKIAVLCAASLFLISCVGIDSRLTIRENGSGTLALTYRVSQLVANLGISSSDLMTQLRSGKTLGQVADATSGKSSSGLVDALVAAEKSKIAAAVTAKKLTQTQADAITANLQQRVTDLVNGKATMHPGGPHGAWGGGAPPTSWGGGAGA